MSERDQTPVVAEVGVHVRRQVVERAPDPVVEFEVAANCGGSTPLEVMLRPLPRDGGEHLVGTGRTMSLLLDPDEIATVEYPVDGTVADAWDSLSAPIELELRRTDEDDADRPLLEVVHEGTAGAPDDRGAAAETLLLGIPAYNEAETIADVVKEAAAYADEVLVVDDGSDDRTARRARAAGATVVRHPDNRGYGGALRTIFQAADDRNIDQLVILDADGQHDPADIPDLVAKRRSTGADVVVGSRFVEGSETAMPHYRRFGLTVVNALTNAGIALTYGGAPVADTQSGFRLYDRDVVESLARDPDLGESMDASIDILFHVAREGYAVAEVPTTVDYEVDDASTHNPVAHGYVLVRNVVGRVCRERPREFLGVPGVAVLCLGLTVGVLATPGTPPEGALLSVVAGGLLALGGALSGGALALWGRTARQ